MFNLCFSDYLRGTHFEFKNGYTVSVQWGPASYCQNYNPSLIRLDDASCRSCADAEIAVFDPAGNFVPPERYGFPYEMDDVVANVTPDRVVDVMAFVKAW
jgi:hypothetical protein